MFLVVRNLIVYSYLRKMLANIQKREYEPIAAYLRRNLGKKIPGLAANWHDLAYTSSYEETFGFLESI